MSDWPIFLQRRNTMVAWMHARDSAARRVIWLAAFSAAACLVVPKGLAVFAVLLALATLMLPEAFIRAPAGSRRSLSWLLAVPVLVLAVAGASMVWSGQGLHVLDNPSRLLLIPWCACLARTGQLDRRSVWLGAMTGLAIAFAIAIFELVGGSDRADAGANPIVFANAVLVLLVVAVFCRPEGRRPWILVAVATMFALSVVTIVLSGSRGVLPGLGLILLVVLVGGNRRRRWVRLGMSASAVVLLFSLLWSVPWLSAQTRLDAVHSDWEAYGQGQVDTPVGARLALLSLAGDAFRRAPWTGVGIDQFGREVRNAPHCQVTGRHLCQLSHAHNDIAQWSATMGLPGLVALLAIYAVPLGVAVALVRRAAPAAPLGAGWAAGMLVVVHVMSGLTQSMFAHAMTTSAYAVFIGLLLGIAMREAADPHPHSPATEQ